MTTTFKTNFEMVILSYCQKMIAVAVGCYLGLYYLLPILSKATDLPYFVLVGFILFSMIVFEAILHVALLSYIYGVWRGEKQLTNLIGGVITFVIIAALGWYSTENLPYFRSSIQEKVSLINTDSIRRVHGERITRIERLYDSKLTALDSVYLPTISKLKNSFWLLAQAQATYNESRSLLLSEKASETEKIITQQAQILADAQLKNEQITSLLKTQDQADARGISGLSLVVLLFSIYSTVAIGNYQKSDIQSTELETVVQNVPSKPEDVVQSQQSALQNNITIIMSSDTRKSEKRLLAEEYVLSTQLFEMEDLKDKEKFQKLNQDLKRESGTSISWGLYSQIKKEWKEGVLV